MSHLIKKCKDDGYTPSQDPNPRDPCPNCHKPLEYYCGACKGWRETNSCAPCAARATLEGYLNSAKGRGDILAALPIAEHLASTYPGSSEYAETFNSLSRVKAAWDATLQAVRKHLNTWSAVKNAERSFDDLAEALSASELPHDRIASIRTVIEDASLELEGMERLKKQAAAAAVNAVKAGIVALVAWNLSHVAAWWISSSVAEVDQTSTYVGWRTALCAAAIGYFVFAISRDSWGIPAYLVGFLSASILGLGLFYLSVVDYLQASYWSGLFVSVLACGGVTWLFDSGVDPGTTPENSLRAAGSEIANLLLGLPLRKPHIAAVAIVVGIIAVPPCLPPPQADIAAAAQGTFSGDIVLTSRLTARRSSRMDFGAPDVRPPRDRSRVASAP